MKYDFKNKFTYDIKGCKECNYTGYFGRIAVFEILHITERLKELIIEGASSIKIRKAAIEEDYRPLFVDALTKTVNGIITLEEVNSKLVLY